MNRTNDEGHECGTDYECMTLQCSDCGSPFLYTCGQQRFMDGLARDGKLTMRDDAGNLVKRDRPEVPRRCMDCRELKKSKYNN